MPVINCTEQVESIDRSVTVTLGGQIPDTSPVVLTTGRQRYSAQEGQAGAYLRARNKYPNFCRFATRRKKAETSRRRRRRCRPALHPREFSACIGSYNIAAIAVTACARAKCRSCTQILRGSSRRRPSRLLLYPRKRHGDPSWLPSNPPTSADCTSLISPSSLAPRYLVCLPCSGSLRPLAMDEVLEALA
jgi:hypothetical protein